MRFQTPPPLNSGDKVAILSPSSGMPFLFPWVYEQGLSQIKDVFKLVPVEFPTARQSPDYLSQQLLHIIWFSSQTRANRGIPSKEGCD